jgi:hypothetical protein
MTATPAFALASSLVILFSTTQIHDVKDTVILIDN